MVESSGGIKFTYKSAGKRACLFVQMFAAFVHGHDAEMLASWGTRIHSWPRAILKKLIERRRLVRRRKQNEYGHELIVGAPTCLASLIGGMIVHTMSRFQSLSS